MTKAAQAVRPDTLPKTYAELVALHLEAIGRAAHAEDEATRLGEEVANELAALVDKKLAEINDSSRRKQGYDAAGTA